MSDDRGKGRGKGRGRGGRGRGGGRGRRFLRPLDAIQVDYFGRHFRNLNDAGLVALGQMIATVQTERQNRGAAVRPDGAAGRAGGNAPVQSRRPRVRVWDQPDVADSNIPRLYRGMSRAQRAQNPGPSMLRLIMSTRAAAARLRLVEIDEEVVRAVTNQILDGPPETAEARIRIARSLHYAVDQRRTRPDAHFDPDILVRADLDGELQHVVDTIADLLGDIGLTPVETGQTDVDMDNGGDQTTGDINPPGPVSPGLRADVTLANTENSGQQVTLAGSGIPDQQASADQVVLDAADAAATLSNVTITDLHQDAQTTRRRNLRSSSGNGRTPPMKVRKTN